MIDVPEKLTKLSKIIVGDKNWRPSNLTPEHSEVYKAHHSCQVKAEGGLKSMQSVYLAKRQIFASSPGPILLDGSTCILISSMNWFSPHQSLIPYELRLNHK
jgi:hypothetical protein